MFKKYDVKKKEKKGEFFLEPAFFGTVPEPVRAMRNRCETNGVFQDCPKSSSGSVGSSNAVMHMPAIHHPEPRDRVSRRRTPARIADHVFSGCGSKNQAPVRCRGDVPAEIAKPDLRHSFEGRLRRTIRQNVAAIDVSGNVEGSGTLARPRPAGLEWAVDNSLDHAGPNRGHGFRDSVATCRPAWFEPGPGLLSRREVKGN